MNKLKITKLNKQNINRLISTIECIHGLSIVLHQYCISQKNIDELDILSSLTQKICEETDLLKAYFINFKVINENTLCLDDTE